jgi:uncharacterized RDD family membrane protein YckC
MTAVSCPACGEALAPGQDRCPACGSAAFAPTEGALAPDLMRHDRLADVPSFRKREPNWKDEVRERVRHRKRSRSDGGELPLFAERGGEVVEPSEPQVEPRDAWEPPPAPDTEASRFELPEEPAQESRTIAEVFDLPLRSPEPAAPVELQPPPEEPEVEAPSGPRLVDLDETPVAEPAPAWSAEEFEPEQEAEAVPALERPAYLGERVQAGLLDGGTIALIGALVVYFAARAARVPPLALLSTWPYVAGFLAFFALVYASFFTGLTGQTLGKMAFRLRVVDRAGAPPGHLRAGLRAALGAIGSLALVGIAPVFFDPARRALHDRLLRTRVIRV